MTLLTEEHLKIFFYVIAGIIQISMLYLLYIESIDVIKRKLKRIRKRSKSIIEKILSSIKLKETKIAPI